MVWASAADSPTPLAATRDESVPSRPASRPRRSDWFMGFADQEQTPALQRHFGLLHATALNVSMIVGAGVFITILGRLTLTVWVGVLVVIAWILVEGAFRFDPHVAFKRSGAAAGWPDDF